MEYSYYAQLNKDNICIAISQLKEEIKNDFLVKLESYDVTILGKKYEKGKWIELPELPVEPTEEEIINAQTLINQASIKNQMNMIDETSSQILLKLVQGGIKNV